ncbi:Dual specificity phosphatase, catalytic domain containing protein [Trichomonas vaginalis G3]|uniref:Dual specificity phosphatase, catalytic domain containing protein n=1 Tax=Trichomonas vaginalis (strain ATCC PRA-98 / G3) TaxID=412133 RepID=A2DR13_TRIV3|nr:protein tyrosine/serine/threonine phosphatase protein [Trichomonas vaginalis G3]EAY17112.1 Dual specificity phosphatase, catalytic domain containing protein [Trichomonas vaginalis G3]KAI5508822.1 protein tyrosine/serine/threonine phosphatase protein [Trichomonas vaginalis G3]|eukprot:XP_001329335.1 Dual specificity phosphatase, catalytic domain containing protein [Trichomonas vaginalis G3]
MLFCDSFSILTPSPPSKNAKTLALSLWRVTQNPLRSSLKSLSKDSLTNIEDLQNNTILALFSLIEEHNDTKKEIDFDFPVEEFKSAFTPEGFLHPLTLSSGCGFCFILSGTNSSILARVRCISFTQVLNSRPIQPGTFFKVDRIFDLFPVATQFALRFPIVAPPFSRTSFLPKKSLTKIASQQKVTELRWEKIDKQSRWREHLSEIIPNIFIASEVVAKNGPLLKRNGITHILNTCEQVCQSAEGFIKLSFRMNDGGGDSIFSSIWKATTFIDDALENNGKVLVHCQEGVSRSTSIVIGYLIIRHGYDYAKAFKTVRSCRRVASPNPRFIAQLLQLSEVCGTNTSSKTCFFSREKQLPFEIIERRGEIIPVPLSEKAQENDEKVFVVVDFNGNDDVGIFGDGDEGKIIKMYGKKASEDKIQVADELIEDLRRCLRVEQDDEDEDIDEEENLSDDM